MIEYVLWFASFIGLFLTLFWLQVIYLSDEKVKKIPPQPVTILVPAYNEEKSIVKTLQSLSELDYPRDKLKIIVINDGSKDKTKELVEDFIKHNKSVDVNLVNREKNSGHKGAALNTGLEHVHTQFFGCVDADSTVGKDSLKLLMNRFYDDRTAAVISTTKAENTNNLLEKLQSLDYIAAAFARMLQSKVDTLNVTPGVLSVYKTQVIKDIGYFDPNNITEDYEIAMRLHYNKYKIDMEPDSITYTTVPSTFKAFWKQRVRWYRGFIYNMPRYRKMFMSKEHGMMGRFQFPSTVTMVTLIYIVFIIAIYEIVTNLYDFIAKMILVRPSIFYILNSIDFKTSLLGIDIKIWFPVSLSFLVSLFIYKRAYNFLNEKWLSPVLLVIYFTGYSLVRSAQWFTALMLEVRRSNRKW